MLLKTASTGTETLSLAFIFANERQGPRGKGIFVNLIPRITLTYGLMAGLGFPSLLLLLILKEKEN